ncbi:MAG: hypothetical protein ACI4NO_03345 [Oxalobacter sp.]
MTINQAMTEEMEDELFDQAIMKAANPSHEELMKEYFADGVPIVFKNGDEPKGFFTQMYPDGHTELVPCPVLPR